MDALEEVVTSVASLYPVGTFVTIFYDPHRPYLSFTSKGLSFYQFIDEIWLLFIITGVFSVVTGMIGGTSIGLLGLGQVGARIFDISVMLAVCLSSLGFPCLLICLASLPFRNRFASY